jgi:hypothetical protein
MTRRDKEFLKLIFIVYGGLGASGLLLCLIVYLGS